MKIFLYSLIALLLFSGCTPKQSFEFSRGEFEPAPWSALEVSQKDFDLFLQSFKKSCDKTALMQRYCDVASLEEFKKVFVPMKVASNGFMTGYYEPLLHGSREKNDRYRYPIYAKPKDMYIIDLSSVYDELGNYRLRGRIVDNKIVPYFNRSQIMQNGVDAEVICYVDSEVDKFFLQIQGSGKVQLDSGETINVGYADQNGHRYYAIGRYMYEMGYLQEVSMQTIRKFLEENPHKMDEILNQNQSYVFFRESKRGATGALGVELTPYASIAVDRNYVPLGFGTYIKSQHEAIQPLAVAQDVGGAINGEGRVDYFFGSGKEAAQLAGQMKEEIEVYLLLPRELLNE
ncbi:MAG: murein transglycosylase A [Campylobacterota bacterium]